MRDTFEIVNFVYPLLTWKVSISYLHVKKRPSLKRGFGGCGHGFGRCDGLCRLDALGRFSRFNRFSGFGGFNGLGGLGGFDGFSRFDGFNGFGGFRRFGRFNGFQG